MCTAGGIWACRCSLTYSWCCTLHVHNFTGRPSVGVMSRVLNSSCFCTLLHHSICMVIGSKTKNMPFFWSIHSLLQMSIYGHNILIWHRHIKATYVGHDCTVNSWIFSGYWLSNLGPYLLDFTTVCSAFNIVPMYNVETWCVLGRQRKEGYSGSLSYVGGWLSEVLSNPAFGVVSNVKIWKGSNWRQQEHLSFLWEAEQFILVITVYVNLKFWVNLTLF